MAVERERTLLVAGGSRHDVAAFRLVGVGDFKLFDQFDEAL
jgi:hypothetical protein